MTIDLSDNNMNLFVSTIIFHEGISGNRIYSASKHHYYLYKKHTGDRLCKNKHFQSTSKEWEITNLYLLDLIVQINNKFHFFLNKHI